MSSFKRGVLGASVLFLLTGLVILFQPSLSCAVPFISKETELAMGQQADREVIAQFGLYPDKSLQLYVNDIGQRLASVFPNSLLWSSSPSRQKGEAPTHSRG